MTRRRRWWTVDAALLGSWLAAFVVGRTFVDGETLTHLVPLTLEWALAVAYATWTVVAYRRHTPPQ